MSRVPREVRLRFYTQSTRNAVSLRRCYTTFQYNWGNYEFRAICGFALSDVRIRQYRLLQPLVAVLDRERGLFERVHLLAGEVVEGGEGEPMMEALTVDIIAAFILACGLYGVLYLGYADRFHHLWFIFFAFTLSTGPLEPWRIVALIVGADDALQHSVQAIQWARIGKGKPAPPETPGWPGMFRSPLHIAYGWVYGLFA